jgi:hypothetical protein
MLPSQGGWPSLAGNEEPRSASQTCGPDVVAQVKILRRPKPHEQNQQSRFTSRTDTNSNNSYAATKRVDDGRNSEQAPVPSSSYYVNDDEWPSIADAESKYIGSQKQKYNVMKKPSDTNPMSNGKTDQTLLNGAIDSSIANKSIINTGNPIVAAQSLESCDTNKGPKPPLKTYKERADEYAKARLRILGSAFSEEDKASHDDILNINRTTENG